MGPILPKYFMELSTFPEKNWISRGDLGQHRLDNFSSRSWGRRGVISSAPQTSFDEINDSVVKSERRELVRSSDPPLVYSAHSTVGDEWWEPIRLLLKTHLATGV